MAFKDWYADNKDSLNARRRKRYKTDAAYREKQLANTRGWRKRAAKDKAKQPPKPKTAFTIGEVATRIGCEQKTIRTLEEHGLIPVMSDGVHHRRFTRRQIGLVEALVLFRRKTHYKDAKYGPGLKKLSARAHAQWE